MAEFTFRNDEWQINGAVIASDIELTLTVTTEHGATFIDLYIGELFADDGNGSPITGWLFEAMRCWVARHQEKLTQKFFDREALAA